MERSDWWQVTLIALGVLVTSLFGVYVYRELFPEYKIYQNAYLELEQFRSTYTGEPVPPFKGGIKQIVLEREDKGPAKIDRCTSCHVAMKFEHFSPTRIARDVNGEIRRDAEGRAILEPNPNDVWAHLERSDKALYEELSTVEVEHMTYDMTKVLAMHPLIGRETRPFEFHPVEEYGCTVCHSGNGRALTTDKAHGPVFDGQYEEEFMGPKPTFVEPDPNNDPAFAHVFNEKPGHKLLFQTTPLYVGGLIEANCVQCHQGTSQVLESAAQKAAFAASRWTQKAANVEKSLQQEKEAVLSLIALQKSIEEQGYRETLDALASKEENYHLSPSDREKAEAEREFLIEAGGEPSPTEASISYSTKRSLERIDQALKEALGKAALVKVLQGELIGAKDPMAVLDSFLEKHEGSGDLFEKKEVVAKNSAIALQVETTEASFERGISDEETLSSYATDIDLLTQTYHEGKKLYISQACYACHRITGLSRGGVGPELTNIGEYYPWYIKESLVWPQANLKTSTMPNFKLDHEELEELMSFLLAQKGPPKTLSETEYQIQTQEWEAGRKLPWEKPVPPSKLHDLRYAMTIFVTEGCAACHRMQGYESNVGFAAEKEGGDFEAVYQEREWFRRLIPEMASGSDIVRAIENNSTEIDRRIIDGVREDSIIEELQKTHPGTVESFYTPFSYARRAKNKTSETPEERKAWQERVERVLKMYIQEYGLGRLIAPRPNWAGVYRSDEWLIGHFRKPSAYNARSIMPVMPFDDSKFYALTNMLDVLGKRNRDALREVWDNRGFSPELAYKTLCSQCHGEYLHGNGPVAEWIYPIPKNLRNADFLRNLTRERVMDSLTHGIKGGPMPPWGEVSQDKANPDDIPVLTEHEISQMTDWLFSSLLGGTVIRSSQDVLKWQYGPEDVVEELKKEGNVLEGAPNAKETVPVSKLHVALNPTPNEDSPGSTIFNIEPNPYGGPNKELYYIKKKYYTDENFTEGQKFFEVNCAVCHGREADGSGYRAGTMFDAKPRMLSNLKWLETRDDLRLLRSIKYGVTGTSMGAWGDQTNSLQRLQLVIFIRMLSEEQQLRDKLFASLYQAFDEAKFTIEEGRVSNDAKLAQVEAEANQLQRERGALSVELKTGTASPEKALDLYKKELTLDTAVQEYRSKDRVFLDLIAQVEREEQLYRGIGVALIGRRVPDPIFEQFLNILKIHEDAYVLQDSILTYTLDTEKEKEIAKLQEQILADVDTLIAEKKKEDEPSVVKEDIKMRNLLISNFEEATRSRQAQRTLINP